jgi:hypothetical protein
MGLGPGLGYVCMRMCLAERELRHALDEDGRVRLGDP